MYIFYGLEICHMDMEGYKGLIFHKSLESFKTKVAMYFLRNHC